MFGILVVTYLFLGGAGAGACAATCLIDLMCARTPFGEDAPASLDEAAPSDRLCAFTLAAGMGALMFGAACLTLDLGRLDRIEALFVTPTVSYLSLGAYALVALIVCGAFLVALRFLYLPAVSRRVVVLVEVITCTIALVVMAYTGLLLQDVVGVRLWTSPWLVVLFVLSSASCGVASALIVAFFQDVDAQIAHIVQQLARLDAAVVALELCAAVLFAASVSGDARAASQAAELFSGTQSSWWWLGFVACSIVAPLLVGVFSVWEQRRDAGFLSAPGEAGASDVCGEAGICGVCGEVGASATFGTHNAFAASSVRVALALAGVFVLVGGFSLRYAVVEAGEHRDMELQWPVEQVQLDEQEQADGQVQPAEQEQVDKQVQSVVRTQLIEQAQLAEQVQCTGCLAQRADVRTLFSTQKEGD